MLKRTRKIVHYGPMLQGEQVAELWVWIWSAVEERQQLPGPQLDEAERLLVAFVRACEDPGGSFIFLHERIAHALKPERCARLAHYLLTRHRQHGAATPESRARLQLIEGAMTIFHGLLRSTVAEMQQVCARMGVGVEPYSTLFREQVLSGVVIESLAEGPVPLAEHQRRLELARAQLRRQIESRAAPRKRQPRSAS